MVETGFKNNVRAGQFSYAVYPRIERMRAVGGSGASYEIGIGLVLAHDIALTTDDTVIIAKNNSVKPFFLSQGDEFKPNSGIGYPMVTNNITDLAKRDTQTSVKVLSQGLAVCYIDGVVLPNFPVIASDGAGNNVLGHLMAGEKDDGEKIFGRFIGLPGIDGLHLARPTPNAVGTLGWVKFPW